MEKPLESLDNPNALSQAIAKAENLLARYEGCIAGDGEDPESAQTDQDEAAGILTDLLHAVELHAAHLSPKETDRIAGIVDRLAEIKSVNNDSLAHYLIKAAISLSTAKRFRVAKTLKTE